jgi:outer membrane murein-binding lipoprotein Lpp/regulator of replication initiation timing
MDKKSLTIVAIILALLFLGSLIWGFSSNGAANELTTENETISAEAEQLAILRDKLEAQVDSLGIVYEGVVADNESLSGQLTEAQQTAKAALYDMRTAQKSRKNDNEVAYKMRLQIEDLINARANLETRLAEVENENKTLRTENVVLRQDLSDTKTEAYNLSKKSDNLETMTQTMEKQINVMTLGAFKATAIQVDMYQGRGTKLTADASRVKRLAVSFDLTNVPDKYLGVRPIYLVLSDQSGTPVISDNPVRAKAIVNGAAMDLIALEGRDVNIEKIQRISFTHELDVKLSAGAYRAQLFTDIGQLGAATVNLR